jgi:pimeloyl-ACP methyl ester carboxylesterase
MPRATLLSGIELEYDTTGDPADPALLLVMGYTAQMISWHADLVRALADQGLFVIRFDNRDCGLSTKLDGQAADPMGVLTAQLAGDTPPPTPYTLSEMAADGIGLLDHLGVDRAHIAGASMGGMIVQTMAIEHPNRVRSLTSIMSSPGDPRVGAPTTEARNALLAPPPTERGAYIEASMRTAVWQSRKYFDEGAVKELAAASFDRSFYPQGAIRQLAAIYASGDRSDRLVELDVPTLVIHGRDDTLITPEGGERTAALVPGSRYLLVADMGHDMPRPLWPALVDAIAGHVRLSDRAVASSASVSR